MSVYLEFCGLSCCCFCTRATSGQGRTLLLRDLWEQAGRTSGGWSGSKMWGLLSWSPTSKKKDGYVVIHSLSSVSAVFSLEMVVFLFMSLSQCKSWCFFYSVAFFMLQYLQDVHIHVKPLDLTWLLSLWSRQTREIGKKHLSIPDICIYQDSQVRSFLFDSVF